MLINSKVDRIPCWVLYDELYGYLSSSIFFSSNISYFFFYYYFFFCGNIFPSFIFSHKPFHHFLQNCQSLTCKKLIIQSHLQFTNKVYHIFRKHALWSINYTLIYFTSMHFSINIPCNYSRL